MAYSDQWSAEGLVESLRRARGDDVRRGISTVGPHRDDVMIHVDGLPTRTHSSQGEQRSVALAMRLAGHRLIVNRIGTDPVGHKDKAWKVVRVLKGMGGGFGYPELTTIAAAMERHLNSAEYERLSELIGRDLSHWNR